MALYEYSKYKIIINSESKKTQGLQLGDVVRRQYFDNPNLIYTLMIVLETGSEIVREKESHYFIGALIEGDEPRQGELLDFVRVTNLFNSDRSGALYLTASDSESPYMDVIDGMATEHSLYLQERPKRITAGEWFMFPINDTVRNPERMVISYKIRASITLSGASLTFGYQDGSEMDGTDTVNVSTDWQYKLSLITVDFPPQYPRQLTIAPELTNDQWCEISDLNIVRLSNIATFSDSTKARIGKITGIIDPVFGLLDGYGAYFQNLYATRNVNIAGTLTAGDENGFASTFYVGKIHKNVIVNSVGAQFSGGMVVQEPAPAGIGDVVCTDGNTELCVQSSAWRMERIGKRYTFSLWIKGNEGRIAFFQDEHYIQDVEIEIAGEWRRYKVPFIVESSQQEAMYIRLETSLKNLFLTAPQMESGSNASQYQPTDEHLSYVEDYGAWFNKGGIGGTIQNPLLRLNEDGSISSRNNSFVIHPDGTGHFASGRFKWTQDTITLQDVTIRWEDLDEDAQNNLKLKSVSLSGQDTFRYANSLDEVCEPEQIALFATELNFVPTSRKWEYMDVHEVWKAIDKQQNDYITIRPDFHGWEARNTLTLRYTASLFEKNYADSFTINKLFDGEDAYSVCVESSDGTIFKNGIISTRLQAKVYKGGEEITGLLPEQNFRWIRTSKDKDSDERWNTGEHRGKTMEITRDDVFCKAVFDCEVTISKT